MIMIYFFPAELSIDDDDFEDENESIKQESTSSVASSNPITITNNEAKYSQPLTIAATDDDEDEVNLVIKVKGGASGVIDSSHIPFKTYTENIIEKK